MSPKDEDEDYGVQGCHGTIAPQQDEAHYDDRSDASDDIEKGRLKFPKRIYGRERELESLLNSYNEVATTVASAVIGASSRSSERGDKKLSYVLEEEEKESYQEVDSYSSRVVFLSGYSGIGKSGKAEKLYPIIIYKLHAVKNKAEPNIS